MNPQWNTPPNGDFASYVERLSAQSALPKRAAQEGDHGLDVGMTPSSEPHGAASAAASAAQRRVSSNGESAPVTPLIGGLVGKLLLGVAAVILLLLWAAHVPVGILVMLAAGTGWLAYKLRQFQSPIGGMAKWQKVLEDAARKQREQQRRTK